MKLSAARSGLASCRSYTPPISPIGPVLFCRYLTGASRKRETIFLRLANTPSALYPKDNEVT
jgi:hypothetical protein